MKERIICAAIWYKDLPTPWLNPVNIEKGVVISGHRHGHCIAIIKTLVNLRTVTFAEDGVGEHEQGFLTNLNRFVDRKEAMEIAVLRDQILENKKKTISSELYSEDIY